MALTWRREKSAPPPEVEDGAPMYRWPNPAKPSALLIPPVVREHRAKDRIRKSVLGGVAAIIAASVLASGVSILAANSAAHARMKAQAAEASATHDVATYYAAATYFNGLEQRKDALTTQLAGDISYSAVATTIVKAKPKNIGLTQIEVNPGTACPGPDPFTATAELGCIQIGGLAPTTSAVGQYVDELNALPKSTGLEDAFAGSISQENGSLAFTISINYNDQVLTHRFVPAGTTVAPTTPAGAAPTGGTTSTTDDGTPSTEGITTP